MAQYIRFAGINAPERDTEAGQVAKDFLNSLMVAGVVYFIVTTEYHEFEKYGRVLAYIYEDIEDINPLNLMEKSLNESMLESGNALAYSGEGPKP
jgi:endonuclease YncB( thermonuclease family)